MLRLTLILALMLVAVAMALSLAHALEMPGKMRLDKQTYFATQKIYYPGFTFGGMAEPIGILVLLGLLWIVPAGASFWWVAGAFAALVAAHATYWLVTHPVNNVWTKDMQLTGPGATFFSSFAGDISGDWKRLREVWEYSHVARACFATASFIFLLVAATA
ncbi:DUF1772 domain-containing protein [Neoaquamicrobium sediminum]|uniref:DUF1772 domain-containing protein n=1 Tax=Neoaquamicrobium sediminum TaxID=1849104 RepID=UPI0040364F1D